MEKETLEEAVNNFKKTDVYINEIKQVQEITYSEEEVLCMLLNNPYQFEDNIKEWFEQNKKK